MRARVLARDSAAVVRNRLYQLRKEPGRFDRFLLDASFVLFNRAADVELQFDGDERSDVDLAVRVRLDPIGALPRSVPPRQRFAPGA